MIDWGDGAYEHAAVPLLPAAEAALDALGTLAGQRVLDLGCGTGNAALLAARRKARVVAIDPAPRLVEVTAARAAAAGLALETAVGGAEAIPAADASFDAVVSIFAVIFAPDAARAADELVRVVKPRGRIAVTTWLPTGPIAEVGMLLRGGPAPAPSPWNDGALLASRGARVELEKKTLSFEAASAEAWFDKQAESHPPWLAARRALEAKGGWRDVRERSLATLRAGNLSGAGFRVESEYLLVKAVRYSE